MWRSVASNGLSFLLVVLFFLGAVVLWGQNQYMAAGPLDQPICLRVEKGSDMKRVSRTLLSSGAIENDIIFRIGVGYAEKAEQLKAGSFLIPIAASMGSIADLVTRSGASTCGTEIVYRIGVTRTLIQVRELDPQTNRFEKRAEFNAADVVAPEIFSRARSQDDTRFRILMAEGVTSWQVWLKSRSVRRCLVSSVSISLDGLLKTSPNSSILCIRPWLLLLPSRFWMVNASISRVSLPSSVPP